MRKNKGVMRVVGALLLFAACSAYSQTDECKNRGQLDTLYCDENKDLVADAPKDPKRWKNPSTLVFTYTPVEDAAVYESAFKPFLDYLGKCTNKRVVYFPVQSNAAEIEAMRAGRLHVGGFSTGPTGFAVNLAGAVPFAIKGTEKEWQGYHLIMIVKKGSPYQKLGDLKGRKVAHTSPSSNSGHLAPQVLFPPEGLSPEKDYKVFFSGGHGQSVKGVESGDYDAAPVASDVFNRMASRGEIKADDFRVIYQSPPDTLHQSPGRADLWRDPVSRHRPRSTESPRFARSAPPHRHGFSGIQPCRATQRHGKRAVRKIGLCLRLPCVAAALPAARYRRCFRPSGHDRLDTVCESARGRGLSDLRHTRSIQTCVTRRWSES